MLDGAELDIKRWRKKLAKHKIKTQDDLVSASKQTGEDIAMKETRDAGERRKIRRIFDNVDTIRECDQSPDETIPCLRGCGFYVKLTDIDTHECFKGYKKKIKDLEKRLEALETAQLAENIDDDEDDGGDEY